MVKTNTLFVFVDGWCPMCVRFGRRIKQLDFLKLIILKDIRQQQDTTTEFQQKGIKLIASQTHTGSVAFGFDTIFRIALRIPLFWLFLPVLYLLKITRLGALLYEQLAVRRTIIPIHCNEKSCKTIS